MQYLWAALVFSVDKPYRRPFFTNKGLDLYLIVALFFSFYIIIKPAGWAKKLITLGDFANDKWRWWVLLIVLLSFIVDFILERIWTSCVEPAYANRNARKIKEDIENNPNKEFKLADYQTVYNYERVQREKQQKK